jgi:hypothetical protein
LLENRLLLLNDLNKIKKEFKFDSDRIPSLGLKTPSSWWTKEDDKTLLLGIIKHGLGKYKDIQEDTEFKWDINSLKQRIESGKDSAIEVSNVGSSDSEVEKASLEEANDKTEEGTSKKNDHLLPSTGILTKRLRKLCKEITRILAKRRRISESKMEMESSSEKVSVKSTLIQKLKDSTSSPISNPLKKLKTSPKLVPLEIVSSKRKLEEEKEEEKEGRESPPPKKLKLDIRKYFGSPAAKVIDLI